MTPSQIRVHSPSDSATSAEWEEPVSSGSTNETILNDSGASTDHENSDEVRCKYPSEFCGRPRARKSNGTCHRFCQYHRHKANTNQKRWTSVRRQQTAHEAQQRRVQEMLQHGYQPTASFPAVGDGPWMPALLPDPVRHEPKTTPSDLPLEDVHIPHALLVNDPATHLQKPVFLSRLGKGCILVATSPDPLLPRGPWIFRVEEPCGLVRGSVF